jgi:hypothetical protein
MLSEAKLAVCKKMRIIGGVKKLSCQQALQVAEDLGVDPTEIGRACEEEGIKLFNCQLGCFK